MGTWSTVENADSRSWRFEERWRDQTLERSWKLFWTPASGTDPYPGDAAIRTNLPVRPQQRLESAVYGTDGVLKRYICRSVTVEPLREAPYSWTVRATFTTEVFPWEATDTWGAEYAKQTRVVGARTVAMFVQGATFPTNGDVSWPPTAAISTGNKVDLNGNPRQYNVAQQQITVESIRDRTASTTTADDPNWATTLTTYINKRNSATFLGWTTGSVLCTGITATLDSEVWRISATFLFDDWYHLTQVALPRNDGLPHLALGATVVGIQRLQSQSVIWFQQFPDKADFNNLYNTTIRNQFTLAGPTRIP
jgi:hypothetical protein